MSACTHTKCHLAGKRPLHVVDDHDGTVEVILRSMMGLCVAVERSFHHRERQS